MDAKSKFWSDVNDDQKLLKSGPKSSLYESNYVQNSRIFFNAMNDDKLMKEKMEKQIRPKVIASNDPLKAQK